MKEETRAGFEQALAGYETRAKAAAAAKEAKFAQRHQFEVDCRRVRDTVILPALKQIAEELLEPRGWTCNVRSVEQTIEATLEIYRSDLKTVSSGERPFIGFKAAPHAQHFTVAWSTQPEGGPPSTSPLEALSEEYVHQRVLEFFQVLALGRRNGADLKSVPGSSVSRMASSSSSTSSSS